MDRFSITAGSARITIVVDAYGRGTIDDTRGAACAVGEAHHSPAVEAPSGLPTEVELARAEAEEARLRWARAERRRRLVEGW